MPAAGDTVTLVSSATASNASAALMVRVM